MLTHKETQAQEWEYLMKKEHQAFMSYYKRGFDKKAIKKTIVPNLEIITANTNLAAAEIELTNLKKRICNGRDFI